MSGRPAVASLIAGLLLWQDRPGARQAAKAVGNMAYPDREALLRSVHDDPDAFVRNTARALVKKLSWFFLVAPSAWIA